MKCESRLEGNTTVLDINGDVVFNTLSEIREVIKQKMNEPDSGNLIINLSNVGMIDSAGVGFIVSMYKTILSRKGCFALAEPNATVKDVLQTVGLTRLFKIFDTEGEAVKSM